MKKIFFASFICTILYSLLVLGVFNVEAQEERTPTVITSDGPLEVDFSEKIAVFQDNVLVQDAQGKVQSDYMKVFFNKEGSEIEKIFCKGRVKIHQIKEGRQSQSEEALYLAKEQKLILTGHPLIEQGASRYRAEKITIFTAQNRVLFEPNAELLIYSEEEGENKNPLMVSEEEE